jgi:hypothetical protein
MNTSSIVRRSSHQRPRLNEAVAATPAREYRWNRQHLYPLDDYQGALTHGGRVRSYCGIEVIVRPGDPADVVEVAQAELDDCVTCVDIWRGREVVRL